VLEQLSVAQKLLEKKFKVLILLEQMFLDELFAIDFITMLDILSQDQKLQHHFYSKFHSKENLYQSEWH
jgi:hypothetical protein